MLKGKPLPWLTGIVVGLGVLTRPFALLDREITLEELIAFSPLHAGFMRQFDAKPADAGFGADWYDAVGFCPSHLA